MTVPNENLSDFADKDYRDGFLDAVTRSGIAYQIKALRRKFGYSQQEMATATDKTQSVVSRLEGSGRASVQTLLDIASALDIALLIRFVSYPEFLARANDMSERGLQPDTIHESLASAARDEWMTNHMLQPRAIHTTGNEWAAERFSASGSKALAAHNRAATTPAQSAFSRVSKPTLMQREMTQ